MQYSVPKTRQVSENIREEVPCRENFPLILGTYDTSFLKLLGNFSLLMGLPPVYFRKSARFLGQCCAGVTT
jgi:hypothetical protein